MLVLRFAVFTCAFAFWPSYDALTELRNKKVNVQEEPRVNPTCDGARKRHNASQLFVMMTNCSDHVSRVQDNAGLSNSWEIFLVETGHPDLSRTRTRSSAQHRCGGGGGGGAWGNIPVSPSEHCSAQSVITGAAVKFAFYIWMNYGWLVTSAALNECSSQKANVATDAGLYMKDCILSPKPRFSFFVTWSKGLQFMTHCYQSKFRSLDGHHGFFFIVK